MAVKYIGNIPKTLRRYADAHEHQIVEVLFGSGYSTDSGNAYDVFLRPGWRDSDDYIHTIIEPTIAITLSKLRAVVPCDCDDCDKEIAKAKAKAAEKSVAVQAAIARSKQTLGE